MMEMRFNGNVRLDITLRVEGTGRHTAIKAEKTVPISEIVRVGDADIMASLEHAQENPGAFVPVSNRSNARGLRPKNYAVQF